MSQKHTNLFVGIFLAVALTAGAVGRAEAISLLNGFGGPRDYGTQFLGRNDDGSTGALPLPFPVNFFGNTYNTFFANNNGNITFNAPLWWYTPTPFPISNVPMIAPFWGDVDTRANPGNGSNLLWIHSPNPDTVVVTWDRVGYYGWHLDKINDFQLVLRNRGDTGPGNFDIDFRYHILQWTTGDASGGSGGLGGTPAQAGFDAGDNTNYQILPGSQTAAVLDLQNTSNVSSQTPGLWTFAVRNGRVPGDDPSNPLMPVVTDQGWRFDFGIVNTDQRIFIDPDIAIGYDYVVNSGPNFASVLLPTGIGDDLYDLYLWSGGGFVFDSILFGGTAHAFAAGGVDRFRILGIEASAGLDPNDPTAFVTGLTFVSGGNVSMTMTPIVLAQGAIPEPSTLTLLGVGIAGLVVASRRRKKS